MARRNCFQSRLAPHPPDRPGYNFSHKDHASLNG
jgi:hypothetical protein